MNFELKPFLELMRRASKCRYPTVFMVNHLIMQCYDINIDSDVGLHYVLCIPDEEAYIHPLYDIIFEISPSGVLKTYNRGHKELLNYKKAHNLKPKEVSEECKVKFHETKIELIFLYYAGADMITKETYQIPIEKNSPAEINITTTLMNLINRIKVNGSCVLMDGLRLGIMKRTLETPGIYYHTIKINDTKVRIPFIKSMFLGNKKLEQFIISIQETTIPNIYLYCIQLTNKGLTECFYGYLQNY